jgi:hypothetical protein
MTGRHSLLYDFLKVTDDVLDRRSRALARLLTAKGRKTSQGDALMLIIRLERYVVQHARDEAPDIKAELERASCLNDDTLTQALLDASEWPLTRLEDVREALAAPSVDVLEKCPGGWRVVGVAERYAGFATKRRESRGRATASRLAKEHGWKAVEGGGWTNPTTSETVETWRELLALLEGKQ